MSERQRTNGARRRPSHDHIGSITTMVCVAMSLPAWIHKTTGKSGPCKVCGPKCNDADKLYAALAIAVEALEYCEKYSPDLFDSEDGLTHSDRCPSCKAKDALRRIAELSK